MVERGLVPEESYVMSQVTAVKEIWLTYKRWTFDFWGDDGYFEKKIVYSATAEKSSRSFRKPKKACYTEKKYVHTPREKQNSQYIKGSKIVPVLSLNNPTPLPQKVMPSLKTSCPIPNYTKTIIRA